MVSRRTFTFMARPDANEKLDELDELAHDTRDV